jgi:hypothetical protein
MHLLVILALAGLPCLALVDSDRRLPETPPAQVGMDAERLARIKPVMEQAIREGQLPGAVILVLRQGKICYRESSGLRSKEPWRVA